VQDRQVFPSRPLRLPLRQYVVGQTETARWKQLQAIAIVREGARLTHQPIDHVTVFDPVLAASTQTRQQLHPLLGVPHFDPLGIQTSLHPLTDQPTGHRVSVAANVDRTAPVHTHAQSLARFQATRRQRTQQRQFLFQPRPPTRVGLLKQPTQERLVLHTAGEVAAATQHQGLVQRPLELAMAMLHVPVLVSMRRLDRLACQTIMTQQCLVTLRERG